MSTANKLTYLNDTKQELKQKINNLGGDITDQTTFRQYADKLQNVYDIFPKTDYSEGSNITLSNTLKGKLDFENDIVGYGQISQEGTPTPETPIEIEVVRGKNRAKLEAEGKYRVFSTGNFATNANFNSYIADVQPMTAYITSAKNIATQYAEISNLCYFDKNMNYISGIAYNTADKSFTTPNNCYYVTMAVNVSIEEVQTEKGSQATSYLPYNTIEVVESGINWFKFDYLSTTSDTANGITFSADKENETFSLTGTAQGSAINAYLFGGYTSTTPIIKLPKGQYTLYADIPTTIYSYDGTTRKSYGFTASGTLIDIPENFYGFTAIKPTNVVEGQTYNLTGRLMILKGNWVNNIPDYQSYQTPQTYQLSLGEYELYSDSYFERVSKGNYNLVSAYEKKRINVNPNTIDTASTNTTRLLFANVMNNPCKYTTLNKCNMLSFKSMWLIDEEGFYNDENTRNIVIRINKSTIGTTLNKVSNYLQNNNLYVVCKLVTPIETPITDTTLINQLENFYNSHSFTGTTIIEIDGQLPLIIKVRALKGE